MRAKTLLVAIALALATPTAADDSFKVVVHPSNAVTSLSRHELSMLFLKKTTAWRGGQAVRPVEPADERLRTAFAKEVHGKSLAAVKSYWNQLVFSGREVPPLEKRDDDAVVDFVRSNPAAIGFVAPGCATAGVKVLAVRD